MTWLLVAFDDDTLAAVLDDARVRSLDGTNDFVLLTPQAARWGDERTEGDDGYLTTLEERLESLRHEGVLVDHDWVPGEDLESEIVEAGRSHAAEGVVIAHHNPNDAIPDPTAFDDAIRDQLGVPLDVISLE
jgi:hypothetical protein